MKKFLLCMSCFLLFTFVACAGSADNGIEPEVETDVKTETIDAADDTGDTADVSDDQDKPFTFDITDYYTERQEQDTSPDA